MNFVLDRSIMENVDEIFQKIKTNHVNSYDIAKKRNIHHKILGDLRKNGYTKKLDFT